MNKDFFLELDDENNFCSFKNDNKIIFTISARGSDFVKNKIQLYFKVTLSAKDFNGNDFKPEYNIGFFKTEETPEETLKEFYLACYKVLESNDFYDKESLTEEMLGNFSNIKSDLSETYEISLRLGKEQTFKDFIAKQYKAYCIDNIIIKE